MKRFLCLFLALVFAVGICFSAPVTITASATEGESQIDPQTESDGTYEYALNQEGTGYILCGLADGATIEGEITLPATYHEKSVVELKDNAFDGVGGITSVTIPGTYEKIGAYVFCDCTELETLEIKEGTKEIGVQAFSDCNKLANVTLPESLEKIGDGAFSETAYDKNKDVNPNEKVSDGTYIYQLTKDETGYILRGPVVNDGVASVNGEITLPETYNEKSVVELKDKAFEGIGGITSVTIPGTYKKIGAYAFCDSTALETVVVKDGVEEIGMYAFSDCSNLVNVTFPDTITKVGQGVLSETWYAGWSNGEWNQNENWFNDGLFVGNIFIDGIPNRHLYGPNEYDVKYGTKTIADKAMYNYSRVYDVIIPKSVENIGEMAFGYYDSTENIDGIMVTKIAKVENFVIHGTKDTAAETYATENGFEFKELEMSTKFQYKLSEDGESYKIIWYTGTDNFSEIVIPSEYNGKPVTEIGSQILCGRSGIISVIVPDSIEIIGDFAFAYCYNLEKITLPDKPLKIGQNILFKTKYYENEENWGNNALYIGNHLLEVRSDNSSETLVVKDGTTDIAGYAFSPTDGTLRDFSFTTLKLPSDLEFIGSGAFQACDNIVSIEINGENKVREVGDYTFEGCRQLSNFPFDKIQRIGICAFRNVHGIEKLNLPSNLKIVSDSAYQQNSIETLIIPAGVVSIGSFAFANSHQLTQVNIGANVKTIEEYAFYDCNALTTISVSSSVESIGKDAFAECDNLAAINVADDNKCFSSVNGVLYNKDKTEVVFCPPKALVSYTIPASLSKIPEDFFANNNITSVTVENGNENFVVEDGVLYSKDMKTLFFCAKDKSGDFTVPESVITVKQNAFKNCENITSVTFSTNGDFESIGKCAFKGCSALTKVVLPQTLKSIELETFYGCKKLVEANIPDTVSFVDSNAFQDTAITNLKIPSAMTRIGSFAFYGMSELLSINIPETVVNIDGWAFSACKKATELVIANGVEYIGPYAFENCYGITEVTIPGSVESVEDGAFANCSSLNKATIYSKKIGKAVFNGCEVLDEIVLKDTIQTIYKQSFIGTPLYDNWNGTDDLYLHVDNDKTKLKFWLEAGSNTGFSGDYTLPTDIITFASGIFEYKTLNNITIPGNIKSLPDYGFNNCTYNSVILNEGLEHIGVEALGWNAYTDGAYKQLVLPSTLKTIEKGAFTWYQVDEFIVTSGENNQFISEDGFVYDRDKTVIYAVPNVHYGIYKMPDTVERFNGDVFYNRSIWEIDFSDSFKEFEPGMFKNHTLSKIVFPEGITEIPDECFENCDLKEIVIPSTVTKIGDSAFKGCYNLESVTLSTELKSIGESAFENCTVLSDINLADTKVETIGKNCFENCLSLESIVMPETLKEIPSRCFAACAKLEGVIFSNVSTIAPSAFFGCVSLVNIIVPGTVEEIGEMALGYGSTDSAATTYSLRMRTATTYNAARSAATTLSARNSVEQFKPAVQMEDVVFYVEVGSEAERYAITNDFEFCDSSEDQPCVPGNWEYLKEPTCTTSGEKIKKCVTCGEVVKTERAEPTGHTFSAWETTTEPTCSKQGVQTQKCTKCGDTQTQNIATIAHSFNENNICSVCNVNKNDLVSLKPYGENLDKTWVYHKDGADRIAITFSSDTYLDSNDIVYIYSQEKNESQTYGDVNNNWSGESSIVEFKECYQWGELQNQRLFFRDTDTVVVRLVTDGNKDEFSTANFEITMVEYFMDKCTHETTKRVNVSEPDGCAWAGWTGDVYCANEDCQLLIESGATIKETPHTVTNWTVYTEATCTQQGYRTGVCDVCKQDVYDYPVQLPHTCGDWVTQVKPNCMNSGYRTSICTSCNQEVQEELPQNGEHTWMDWQTEVYATCTEDGYEVRYCQFCWEKDTETKPIPATGHKAGEWQTECEPSCSEEGYKYKYCIYCDDVMDEETIPATGHKAGEWQTECEPSCNEEGYKYKYCIYCYDVMDEETIPKTAHSWSLWDEQDASCSVPGIEYWECEECCGGKCVYKPKIDHSFSNGVCTECNMSESVYNDVSALQSTHPIKTTDANTYTLTKENVARIVITFSGETNIGSALITITDSKGSDLGTYTGGELANKTIYVHDNTVNITLSNVEADDDTLYGFEVINVKYYENENCEHENTHIENSVIAGCVRNGYTGDTICSDCGVTLEIGVVIEATGHSVEKYTTVREATCLEPSKEIGYCKNCCIDEDVYVVKYGEKLNHSFSNGICTSCGKTKEVCDLIDDIRTEHPFKSNESFVKTITKEGAKKIAVTFSELSNVDVTSNIRIYTDAENKENSTIFYDNYNYIAGDRIEVLGDTLIIEFTAGNNNNEYYGFSLTNVEFCTNDTCAGHDDSTETMLINQKDSSCYSEGYTGDEICVKCWEVLKWGEGTPATHTFEDWKQLSAPTCNSYGQEERTCSKCDEGYSKRLISRLEHTFENGVCKTCSNTEYVCGFIDTIESEHPYGSDSNKSWIITNPCATKVSVTFSEFTYTEEMYDNIIIYDANDSCIGSYDGSMLQGKTIEVEGNTVKIVLTSDESLQFFGFAITDVEFTFNHGETKLENQKNVSCTEDGYTGDKVCKICGLLVEKGEVLDSKGHTPVNGGEKGVHSKCSVCEIPLSTTHTYSRSETQPTCENTGTVKYSCTCGYYYTETKKALGHSYNAGEVTIKATCTKDGEKTFTCTRCNGTKTETISKTGHDYETNFTTDKESTCTEYGSKSRHCKNCNEKIDVTVIDMKGHAYDEGKVTTDPTCTTTGIKTFTCGRCKVTKTSVVSATGHKEVAIPAVASTCTVVGKTEGKKCSVCNEILVAQKDVAKLAHETTVVNKKDATCTAEGYTGDTQCTVCKTVTAKGTAVEKIAHKTTVVGAKKATAKEAGYTGDTKCTVCGTVTQKGTTIAKLTLAAPKVTQKNTAKGISLTWGKVANAESYRVYRRTYNTKTKKYSEWTTLSKAQKGTSFVDTKVKLGTTYSYMVKAINSGVLSKGTPTKNLKYNVTPTVTVANASKGISVSWSPIANATGYEVYSSTYNAKTKKWSSFTKRATAKANAKSWTDTKAKSGTKYKYTVKALNGKVASAYNKSGVQIVRLAQPTTKIVNASNGIKVSWGKVSGATSYEILRAEYNAKTKKWSTAKKVATAKSSATSWTDTKVKSGVQYRYTVKAVNGKIYSSAKTTSGLMFLTMPKTTVKAVKNGITVTWTQSTGATSYEVYRAEYNKKTKKYTAFKKVATAKSTAKSYTDKTAKKGVKYKYTVKAVNNKTASAYKASAEVKR